MSRRRQSCGGKLVLLEAGFLGEEDWVGLTITLSASEIRACTSGLKSANISSIVFFRSGSDALGWAIHSGKAATTFRSLFLLCYYLAQMQLWGCWTGVGAITYRHGYVMKFLPPWSAQTVRSPSFSVNFRASESLTMSDVGIRSRNVVTPNGWGS